MKPNQPASKLVSYQKVKKLYFWFDEEVAQIGTSNVR